MTSPRPSTSSKCSTTTRKLGWSINGFNVFKLQTGKAKRDVFGVLKDGNIVQEKCLRMGSKTLPLIGTYREVFDILQKTSDIHQIHKGLVAHIAATVRPEDRNIVLTRYYQVLEVMAQEGWIKCEAKPGSQTLQIGNSGNRFIRFADATKQVLDKAGRKDLVKYNMDEAEPELATA